MPHLGRVKGPSRHMSAPGAFAASATVPSARLTVIENAPWWPKSVCTVASSHWSATKDKWWYGTSYVYIYWGGPEGFREDRRTQLPVSYNGARVAELAVDAAPEEDRSFLERVAVLISAHCLVGWDTGGEAWKP